MPLGLGLGLGMTLPPTGAEWTPADLGASLLAWWDASRTDSLTLSGTSATGWADVVGGVSVTQAVSASRPRWDASLFGGVLNKNSNVNVNPQNTANMTVSGDPAAVFGVADDTAALVADGAAPGNVYVLDNRLGVAAAYVFASGNTGNTNLHTGAVRVRGGSGTLAAPGTTAFQTFGTSAGYRRVSGTFTPGATNNVMRIGADAGQIVYFYLNGLYEGADPGVDVRVNGAAAYGFGRPGLLFDGADDFLGYDGVLSYPIGDAPSEVWGLVDQMAPDTDASTRGVGGYHGGGTSTSRTLRRQQFSGLSRGTMGVGDGATAQVISSVSVAFNGRHAIRGTAGGGLRGVDVDGTGYTTGVTTAATAATQMRIGALTSLNFWQGAVSQLVITGPLTDPQAAQLFAYLKARGGI